MLPAIKNTDQRPDDVPMNLDGEQYLGSLDTLLKVVSYHTSDLLEHLTGKGDAVDQKLIDRTSLRVAEILLGRDQRYVPMSKWNEPGIIDAFIKNETNSQETTPIKILTHAVKLMFEEIFDVLVLASEGETLDEQYEWEYKAVLTRWSRMFLGIGAREVINEGLLSKFDSE